jgi:hypothetical protein
MQSKHTEQSDRPTHFKRVNRYMLSAPMISGVVHRVRWIRKGEMRSYCGISEICDNLSPAEGDTTCERCKVSEPPENG